MSEEIFKLACPCCRTMIEINARHKSATCVGTREKIPVAPKEGGFFDKVLHPPTLTQDALNQERERFKQEFGALPEGSKKPTSKDPEDEDLDADRESC